MAINKQQKRTFAEANLVDNNESKKSAKQLNKAKTGKSGIVQNNGVSLKKGKKGPKFEKKTEVKNAVKKEIKKEVHDTPVTGNASNVAQKNPKKAAKLLKKNENRKAARKEQGQYKPGGIILSVDAMKKRIAELEEKTELSKTARRRLRVLRIKVNVAESKSNPTEVLKKDGSDSIVSEKRKERKQKKIALLQKRKQERAAAEANATKPAVPNVKTEVGVKQKNKPIVKTEGKKPVVAAGKDAKPVKGAGKKQQQQLKGKQAKQALKAEPEDSEEEEDEEEEDVDSEEAEDTNVSLNTTEEQTDEDDEEDDDEEEEDDDDEEDDDEEEEDDKEEAKPEIPAKKIKQEPGKVQASNKETKKEHTANGDTGKKKRFVLFVGNLPFTATADDIKKHFLTKVSDVSSVRVPMKPGSNVSRGFAYVELTNATDYEKGLSLHNTTIINRKINVQYTLDGSKSGGNKHEVVAKNKKLHALRKQGKLAGSQKDGHKRSDRRQKQKQQRPS